MGVVGKGKYAKRRRKEAERREEGGEKEQEEQEEKEEGFGKIYPDPEPPPLPPYSLPLLSSKRVRERETRGGSITGGLLQSPPPPFPHSATPSSLPPSHFCQTRANSKTAAYTHTHTHTQCQQNSTASTKSSVCCVVVEIAAGGL